MDLTEQIARALYEADDHHDRPWVNAPSFVQERYLRIAQSVLPPIAAERERCVGVAYTTCAETRHVTLGDKVATAIRNQP